MPRRKKSAGELTTDEALRKLFPPEARKEVKKTAVQSQKKPSRDQSR
jgi:hypothetical protein